MSSAVTPSVAGAQLFLSFLIAIFSSSSVGGDLFSLLLALLQAVYCHRMRRCVPGYWFYWGGH